MELSLRHGWLGRLLGAHERIFAIMQKPILSALTSHHLDPKLVYLNLTDPFK
jgi:hypothetical protein